MESAESKQRWEGSSLELGALPRKARVDPLHLPQAGRSDMRLSSMAIGVVPILQAASG